VRELAADYQGRVRVVIINSDENPLTYKKYRDRGLPLTIFFKDGQLDPDKALGSLPTHVFVQKLEQLLAD